MKVAETVERHPLPPIEDLLAEVAEKNHVRVQVYRAVRPDRSRRAVLRRTLDELADTTTAFGPALWLADSLRALKGLKPVYTVEALRRLNGQLVGVSPNLRVNVGIDFCATQLGSTAPTTQADYIALSNNTITPGATDTSSTVPWSSAQAADAAGSGTTGEWTALGLTRKQATYAHTTSATSYTMSATWTATATATGTRLAGLFGGSTRTAQAASGTNILFLENTFTATTLNNTDQLSLTWTVNI